MNRIDASPFLQGLASRTGSEELAMASNYFRLSAENFARCHSLIENEIESPGSIPNVSDLVETELDEIADYEEKAAVALQEGAEDVRGVSLVEEENDELEQEVSDLKMHRNILLAALAIIVLISGIFSYKVYKKDRRK